MLQKQQMHTNQYHVPSICFSAMGPAGSANVSLPQSAADTVSVFLAVNR